MTPQQAQEILDACLAHRKKHFAVVVEPARQPEEVGAITLSFTQNGRQWQTVGLLQSEIPQVIAALQNIVSKRAEVEPE